MIILTSTDNLQIVLGGSVTTNQLQCTASWRDITTTTYDPGNTLVNTNNTTDVNIVSAPAALTQRIIDFISVYNADTALQSVTIKYDVSGTEKIIIKKDIPSLGTLYYQEGKGFEVLSPTPYGYTLAVQALTSSPGDGATTYFGNKPGAPGNVGLSKVYIRKAGTIKIAEIYTYSGTAGTAENWSFYVRVNNTTDYLIATIGAATNERIFSNTGLTIPVAIGDYFEIKMINPTWVTNPLTTIIGGYLYIE